jgi:uncharacterized membrane protein
LADALSETGRRLREIGIELRGIALQRTSGIPSTVTRVESSPSRPTTELATPPPPVMPPRPMTPPVPPAPQLPEYAHPLFAPSGPTLWERMSRDGAGSRILAWAGGVVTLAGVVLLLILAIQRGYLGPLPRVLLGTGLGLTLVGFGMLLHRHPNARTGAYALAATGIAVLYLDVIAATTLYEFLLPYAGLTAGLVVAAAGTALAGRWDSQMLAVFVVVCCAVSAPILTEGFVAVLLGFLLVLQIAATPVQLGKRWGWLCLAAGLPPVVTALISVALAEDSGFGVESATIATLCLVTSVVQVVLATGNALRQLPDDLPFALLLVAPAPAMLAAILVPRATATVLPAAIGGLLVVVWGLHRARMLPVSDRFASGAGGAGVLAVFQATGTALDGGALAIALLGEALLVALLALTLRYAAALLAAGVFALAGLVASVAVALPPRMLAVAPAPGVPLGTAVTAGLTGLLLAVVAIVLCWVATRLGHLASHDHAVQGWMATGVTALYGATGAMLSIGLVLSPDRSGFLVGHVLVTVSWTVGALALLLRGIDSVPLRVAGLTLVGAAVAKLVLFDLSSLDGLARVAAFLIAGLVLLATGARYAKLVATRGRGFRASDPTPGAGRLPGVGTRD